MVNVLISLSLLLGMFIQAYFLLRGKLDFDTKNKRFWMTDLGTIIGLLAFCLLIFIVILIAEGFSTAMFLFSFYSLLFFSVTFRDKILPVITEQKLLQMSILITYLLFIFSAAYMPLSDIISFWQWAPWFMSIIMLLIAAPLIGVLIISFTSIKLSRFWKIMFYTWFLLMTVAVIIYQVAAIGIFNFLLGAEPLGYIDAFLLGAVLFILATYMLPLASLISKDPDGEEIRDLLSQRYSDKQMNTFSALITLALYSVPLILNYYLKLVPAYTIISIMLLITFYHDYFKKEEEIVKN